MQQKPRSSNSIFFTARALPKHERSGVLAWVQSLPPSLLALCTQILATLLVLLVFVPLIAYVNLPFPLIFYTLVLGTIAAFFGLWLGLASWWFPINALFTSALVLTLSFAIPPLWFLSAFVLLFLVYWSVFRSQVPLYLSSRKAWIAVNDLLPIKSGVRFMDVGAGLGGMLSYLNARHPEGYFSGMEIAPLPFIMGWIRKKVVAGKYSLMWGDFWACSLAGQDVVYAYLSPVPMVKLWHKACSEMAPGTRLISNAFLIPDVTPERIVDLDDFHHSKLYVYLIPERNESGKNS